MRNLHPGKIYLIASAVLLVVGLPATLFLARTQNDQRSRASEGGATGISAVVTVNPQTATTSCPATITFTGTITSPGAGTITYKWLRSDGALDTNNESVTFTEAGSKTVTTTWRLGSDDNALFKPFKGWEAIRIVTPIESGLTPEESQSNQAAFSLTCEAAAPLVSPTLTISPTTLPSFTPPTSPTPTLSPFGREHHLRPHRVPVTPFPTPIGNGSNNRVRFNLTLLLHGIGRAGDNVTPGRDGNLNPKTPDREVVVGVYDAENKLMTELVGSVTYDPTDKSFKGAITTDVVPPGVYQVSLDLANFPIKDVPAILQIGAETTAVTVPQTEFVTGDVNDDDLINIVDYQMINDCYVRADGTSKNCDDPVKKAASDLNDDGKVDLTDLNLFQRELSTYK